MENEYISNKKIIDIKPYDKNIDIKVIVIGLVSRNKLKSDITITTFHVADYSGSIHCNFFEDVGEIINEGDILFLRSAYATIFKNNLILYTSKPGLGQIIKLGEYFMLYAEVPNMSTVPWRKETDERGQEIYVIDNIK
jgi:hypothetical protein